MSRSKRTACTITREQFRAHSKPLMMDIEGQKFSINPWWFGTGSLGWYMSGRLIQSINNVPMAVQMNCTFTIIGSKDLPPEVKPEGDGDAGE